MLGHDFLPFYFAGTCARTGHLDKLYDLDYTRAFEQKTGLDAGLDLGNSFGPWWNPPFAAWLFAPFSALPYLTALHCFWALGFICLAISIYLMSRMLAGGWKTRLLVPLFMLISMPCFQAFSHGQNTYISLLLLTSTVTLWRANRALAAGLVCGLLFYKPQLGAVVAIILSLSQGRRAMLGIAITGVSLLLLNIITMPGTIHLFLSQLPGNLHWMLEENNYSWERHVTFKAFWRLTIQGWSQGPTATSVNILWAACEITLLAGMFAVVRRTLRQAPDASRTDRLIAAAIVSMPLLMPFYFDYDLLLISVAAVVYAADRQRLAAASPPPNALNPEDRWLTRIWITLFITLEFGAVLAGNTRVHPAVPLVTIVAALLIRRALRPQRNISAKALLMSSPSAIAA